MQFGNVFMVGFMGSLRPEVGRGKLAHHIYREDLVSVRVNSSQLESDFKQQVTR